MSTGGLPSSPGLTNYATTDGAHNISSAFGGAFSTRGESNASPRASNVPGMSKKTDGSGTSGFKDNNNLPKPAPSNTGTTTNKTTTGFNNFTFGAASQANKSFAVGNAASGGTTSGVGSVPPTPSNYPRPVHEGPTQASRKRGSTLFPLASKFYYEVTNVAYHHQNAHQVKYTELKNMYFDKKVSDYFSQVFDIPAKNTADCQALMKGQVKDISAEDLTPEVKEIVLSLADELELNELVCLDYYVAIFRDSHLIRTLEEADKEKGSGYYSLHDPIKVKEAVKDLFLYEKSAVLKSLSLLLKLFQAHRIKAEKDFLQRSLHDNAGPILSRTVREDDDENDEPLFFDPMHSPDLKELMNPHNDPGHVVNIAQDVISKCDLNKQVLKSMQSRYTIIYREYKHAKTYKDIYHPPSTNTEGGVAAGGQPAAIQQPNGVVPTFGNFGVGNKGAVGGFGGAVGGFGGAKGFAFGGAQQKPVGFGTGLNVGQNNQNPPGQVSQGVMATPAQQIRHSMSRNEPLLTELQILSEIFFYSLGGTNSVNALKIVVALQECIMSFGQELNREHITPDMTEMEQQLLYSFKVPLGKVMLALQLSLTNCIHMCARDSNIAIDAILEVLPQQYKDLDTEDQDQDRKDLYDRGRTGMGRQGHAALSMILLSYYSLLQFRIDDMWSEQYQDVAKSFVTKINESRVFTYLRLCVLPLLQTGTKNSDGDHTQQRYVNDSWTDYFRSYIALHDTIVDVYANSEEVRDNTESYYELANLLAATLAVYPNYSSQFVENENSSHMGYATLFKQYITVILDSCHKNKNTLIPAVYILAGLADGGDLCTETVYRFLDKNSGSAAPPGHFGHFHQGHLGLNGGHKAGGPGGAASLLSWRNFLDSIDDCNQTIWPDSTITGRDRDYVFQPGSSTGGSVLKSNYEKTLLAILNLIQSVTRSPLMTDNFIREHKPVEPLFKLLCGPVSVELKGSVFRALASLARSCSKDSLDLIWRLIENHRLLPNVAFANNLPSTKANDVPIGMSAGGMAMPFGLTATGSHHQGSHGNGHGDYGLDHSLRYSQFHLQGLRLELEDIEQSLGVYMVTDGFLMLLDALLSRGCVDDLGKGSRYTGISHLLEFVVEDVMLVADARYYNGAVSKDPSSVDDGHIAHVIHANDRHRGGKGANNNHNNRRRVDQREAMGRDSKYGGIRNEQRISSISSGYSALSEAQKYRLKSRCLNVLSSILSHYPIHKLVAMLEGKKRDRVSNTNNEKGNGGANNTVNNVFSGNNTTGNAGMSSDDDMMQKLKADFEDCIIDYEIDGHTYRNPRLKSAGFNVMTMLLSNSHHNLQENIFGLLSECSGTELSIARTNQYNATAVLSSRLSEVLFQLEIENDPNYGFHGYQGEHCDGYYWRRSCVASAVGLLYECVLREDAFYSCFDKAPQNVLKCYISQGGQIIGQDISLQRMPMSLYRDKDALCSLVNLLCYNDSGGWDIPGVAAMASFILKKVVKQMSTEALMEFINRYGAKHKDALTEDIVRSLDGKNGRNAHQANADGIHNDHKRSGKHKNRRDPGVDMLGTVNGMNLPMPSDSETAHRDDMRYKDNHRRDKEGNNYKDGEKAGQLEESDRDRKENRKRNFANLRNDASIRAKWSLQDLQAAFITAFQRRPLSYPLSNDSLIHSIVSLGEDVYMHLYSTMNGTLQNLTSHSSMTYTSIGTSGNSDQLGSYAPYLYRNLNGSGNGNGGDTGRPRVGGGMEVHEQSGIHASILKKTDSTFHRGIGNLLATNSTVNDFSHMQGGEQQDAAVMANYHLPLSRRKYMNRYVTCASGIEVILDFLLTTLEDDRVCLSHLLLGLVPFIASTKLDRWDLKLAPNLHRTGLLSGGARNQMSRFPDTCLGHILLMIEDSQELIVSAPKTSGLCYELMYSLCKSKITSHVTLSLLRHYTITIVTPPGGSSNRNGTQQQNEEASIASHRFLAFCLKQVLYLARLKDDILTSKINELYDASQEGAYSYSSGSLLRRNNSTGMAMDALTRGSIMGSPMSHHFYSSPGHSNTSFNSTHAFNTTSNFGHVGLPDQRTDSFDSRAGDAFHGDDVGPRSLNFSPTLSGRSVFSNDSPHESLEEERFEMRTDDQVLRDCHFDEVRVNLKCIISWLLRLFALEFRCMEELAKNHGILAIDLLNYTFLYTDNLFPIDSASNTDIDRESEVNKDDEATGLINVFTEILELITSLDGTNDIEINEADDDIANLIGKDSNIYASLFRSIEASSAFYTVERGGMENSHRHLKGLQDTRRAANKMTLVEGGLFDDAYKLFVEPVIRNTHTNANTNMLGHHKNANLSGDVYRLGVRLLSLMNKKARDLAVSIYLCEAWEQCVSTLFICFGKYLLTSKDLLAKFTIQVDLEPAQGGQLAIEGAVSSRQTQLQHQLKKQEIYFLLYLVTPALNLAQTHLRTVDSNIIEHLTKTVYVLINCSRHVFHHEDTVQKALTRTVEVGLPDRARATPSEYSKLVDIAAERDLEILQLLVKMLWSLQQSQIKDVHCAPKLRGYLYASISSFLKPYIDDDNNTLVSSYLPVIQRKPLPGDVGGSDSDSDSDDGLPATSTKYKVRVSETLECNIMYLIDTLCMDALAGPLLWKLNSIGTICSIYALLNDASKIHALQSMLHQGYLQQLLRYLDEGDDNPNALAEMKDGGFGNERNISSSTVHHHSWKKKHTAVTGSGKEEDIPDKHSHDLSNAILSLCIHITSTSEGADSLLIEGDVLHRLHSLLKKHPVPSYHPVSFETKPHSRSDTNSHQSQARQEDNARVIVWCTSILPVFRLLRALAFSGKTRYVLQDIAGFLHSHSKLLHYILALEMHEAIYMQLVECVLSLIKIGTCTFSFHNRYNLNDNLGLNTSNGNEGGEANPVRANDAGLNRAGGGHDMNNDDNNDPNHRTRGNTDGRSNAINTSAVHPPVPTMWESLGRFINDNTRRFIGNNLVAPPSSDDTATTGPRGGGGLASARHNNASGPLRGRGGDFDDSDSENSINRNFNWMAGFMNPNDPTRRRGEAGVNRAADQDDDPSDFFRLRVPNFDGTGRKYYKVSEVVDMNSNSANANLNAAQDLMEGFHQHDGSHHVHAHLLGSALHHDASHPGGHGQAGHHGSQHNGVSSHEYAFDAYCRDAAGYPLSSYCTEYIPMLGDILVTTGSHSLLGQLQRDYEALTRYFRSTAEELAYKGADPSRLPLDPFTSNVLFQQGLANSSGINREGNYDYTHGYRTNNDISHASSSRKGSGALLSRGRENKHDYYGRRDSDSNLMAVSASRCLPPAEVLAAHVRLELCLFTLTNISIVLRNVSTAALSQEKGTHPHFNHTAHGAVVPGHADANNHKGPKENKERKERSISNKEAYDDALQCLQGIDLDAILELFLSLAAIERTGLWSTENNANANTTTSGLRRGGSTAVVESIGVTGTDVQLESTRESIRGISKAFRATFIEYLDSVLRNLLIIIYNKLNSLAINSMQVDDWGNIVNNVLLRRVLNHARSQLTLPGAMGDAQGAMGGINHLRRRRFDQSREGRPLEGPGRVGAGVDSLGADVLAEEYRDARSSQFVIEEIDKIVAAYTL